MASWNEKTAEDMPEFPSGSNDWDDDNDEDEVTALHDFVAGGLAGSASVVVGHPFDTIKVRLQTSQTTTSLLSVASYLEASKFDNYITINTDTSTVSSDDNDIKNRDFLDDVNDVEESSDPWQKSFLCGSFAGFVQCVVICPMEHVKCRLQVQHGKGSADNLYNGPLDATKSILKNHGVSGLFRGWWCTCLREVPAFGLYFTTYDYIKDNVNTFLPKGPELWTKTPRFLFSCNIRMRGWPRLWQEAQVVA